LPGDALPEAPFDLVVIDASFISVIPLLDRVRAFLADDGRIVALVKPQFEAGVERLGRGGVVRDAEVHRAILREFRNATVALGLVPQRIVPSHLRGPAGNVEFFALIARDGVPVDDAACDAAVAGVPA
jgi:23S rRNA (cytidine1920-2'-O)/16S rRNA (cytidine1409-2'-O)-methyltransferase